MGEASVRIGMSDGVAGGKVRTVLYAGTGGLDVVVVVGFVLEVEEVLGSFYCHGGVMVK